MKTLLFLFVLSIAMPQTLVLGDPPETDIDVLIEAVNHRDPQIREHAAKALRDMGPKAEKAIPALIQALRTKKPQRSGSGQVFDVEVADALAAIGPAAIAPLVEVFEHEEQSAGEGAGKALSQIRPIPEEFAPGLLDAAKDVNAPAWRRIGAVSIIGNIPNAANDAVPVLTKLVDKDVDPQLVLVALHSLGRIGPKAESAVPTLMKFLRIEEPADERPGVVGRRGNSYFGYLRDSAIGVLGSIGPAAKEAVPQLIELAKIEKDSGAPGGKRRFEPAPAAMYALGKIGPDAKAAIPTLIPFLADEDAEWRAIAATSLGNMGPAAKDAIPELEKAIRLERLSPDGKSKVMEEALRKINAK